MLLEQDRLTMPADETIWQDYLAKLQNSFLLGMMREGRNQGPEWQELSDQDKESILCGIAQLHEQTFNYRGFDTSIQPADDPLANHGFYTVLLPRDADGAIGIPNNLNATASFQLLTYGMAKSFLSKSVCADLALFKEKNGHSHTSDIHIFDYQGTNFDHQHMQCMHLFPMPDEFDSYLELPSNVYAIQAVKTASENCLGISELDPEFLNVLHRSFMQYQYTLAAMNLDINNNPILRDARYLDQWAERTKLYIEESVCNPSRFAHDRTEAAKLITPLRRNKPDTTFSPDALTAIENDVESSLYLCAAKSEAIGFIEKASTDVLSSLAVPAQLHLLKQLGKQNDLDEQTHKMCDTAAVKLLAAQKFDDRFMAFYTGVINNIAIAVSRDPFMTDIEERWADEASMADKLEYLTRLNAHACEHFELEEQPKIFTYNRQKPSQGRYNKEALGFAAYRANAEDLKEEYGLRVEDGLKIIGLSAQPHHGLFKSPDPSFSSSVLIHEIGHHVHDHLENQEADGKILKDDPRYLQIQCWNDWDTDRNIVSRLRNEFSDAVYGHIPRERFPVFCQTVFYHAMKLHHP